MEFLNEELCQVLQKKSKLSLLGPISWKTFLFPSITRLHKNPKKAMKYFGIDLVEDRTHKTVWTHKASIWQILLASVKEVAEYENIEGISTMFDGILACPVRAVPKGANEIETFKSAKGQLIQHWIMLVPMPLDKDYLEYIPQFIFQFQELWSQPYIRAAYKNGVKGITQHSGLINQISEDGNYWDILDKAVQKDIIHTPIKCLSEVLLNDVIDDVVDSIFGVKPDSSTWDDFVKEYAFGK